MTLGPHRGPGSTPWAGPLPLSDLSGGYVTCRLVQDYAVTPESGISWGLYYYNELARIKWRESGQDESPLLAGVTDRTSECSELTLQDWAKQDCLPYRDSGTVVFAVWLQNKRPQRMPVVVNQLQPSELI